jgi:hypothetical protein
VELNGEDISSKMVIADSVTALSKMSSADGNTAARASMFTLHIEEKPEKAVLCIRW